VSQDLTVLTDADNTLWDTNRVYANAQLGMLKDLEKELGLIAPENQRLEFVRRYDEAIATKHHQGFRYPPAMLSEVLALGLQGETPSKAYKKVWGGSNPIEFLGTSKAARIETRYLELLKELPELRPGVLEGFKWLEERNIPIFVVTEGDKKRIVELLFLHGLSDYVSKVIEGKKSLELYKRLLQLTGNAENTLMIGDQLDRDVLPAQKAGLIGVHFPGGFNPVRNFRIEDSDPNYEISSFDQIAAVVSSVCSTV